jgi:hypothetical protein
MRNATLGLEGPPPLSAFQPSSSSRSCLALVVRCTQTLTVINIEWLATIRELNDVVGIDAVMWCCFAAPLPIDNGLAPIACTLDHLGTPGCELRRVVDPVDLPRRGPHERGDGAHQGAESAKLGHVRLLRLQSVYVTALTWGLQGLRERAYEELARCLSYILSALRTLNAGQDQDHHIVPLGLAWARLRDGSAARGCGRISRVRRLEWGR